MVSLPVSHVMDKCLYQQMNKQCRYLAEREDRENEFICLKTLPYQKLIIDNEVIIFEVKKSKNVESNIINIIPFGDNCKGFDQNKGRFILVGS